jgi:hypothetical protein
MSHRLSRQPAPKKVRALLGVGLDQRDGHKRVTQGEKFAILGGSRETHERLTETVVKTMEDISRKGQELEDTEPREIADLLHKNTPA